MRLSLFFVLLTTMAASAWAQYECSCSGIELECLCPSSDAPGGLSVQDMPQFIVVTNDDAVTQSTNSIIRSITSDVHRNVNQCPIPATWFVSIDYTEKNLVSALYEEGHEIAAHTFTHPSVPDLAEIGTCRDWLVKEAGVPQEHIQGFRSPFLLHSPEVRSFLYQLGFRYDSSITEQASQWSATSKTEESRVFPYTLQNGVAQTCTTGTGTCNAAEKYPGMWELPMWNIEDAAGTPIASMDLAANVDVYESYKLEFDRRYSGNRAPLGIFLHAGLTREKVPEINRFIEFALGHQDVWFVTNSQLLDFMSNPMSAAEYRRFMTRDRQCGSRKAFDSSVWKEPPVIDYNANIPPATREPFVAPSTLPPAPTFAPEPSSAPINNPDVTASAVVTRAQATVAGILLALLVL